MAKSNPKKWFSFEMEKNGRWICLGKLQTTLDEIAAEFTPDQIAKGRRVRIEGQRVLVY